MDREKNTVCAEAAESEGIVSAETEQKKGRFRDAMKDKGYRTLFILFLIAMITCYLLLAYAIFKTIRSGFGRHTFIGLPALYYAFLFTKQMIGLLIDIKNKPTGSAPLEHHKFADADMAVNSDNTAILDREPPDQLTQNRPAD